MIKQISVVLTGLFLVACGNIPDQTSRAYWNERCKFDSWTFAEYKIGDPDHQFCIEQLESGIDPEEDWLDGDGNND